MITICGISGYGGEVGNDWCLTIIIINVAAQDGEISGGIALTALRLCPSKASIERDTALELEGDVTVCIRGGLVRPGHNPNLIVADCGGQRGL
jgi:hypothetical protein